MIRVVVSGSGNMGAQVLAALEAADDLEPVGVIEPLAEGEEADSHTIYAMHSDPEALFARAQPDVVVDFTNAAFTPALTEACLAHGVRPVIGTSGQPDEFVAKLREQLAEASLGGVIAPNFALGAVVLMHLARIAAPHFDAVEVIELHHDGKVDSPSGTAVATAQLLREARGRDFSHRSSDLEALPGARGAELGGVALHSVRLPGLVAHQEVIFGGVGQTLTLRHDSTGRDSFMPGVLLAVREVMQRQELIYGLDALIGLE
jgi:4-hydroxy-tetrahydrodipicolinate reductase